LKPAAAQFVRRKNRRPLMLKLRYLSYAVLALLGASVPVAAYTGYYAPTCGWGTVWSLSGAHYQYLCF
jgi:hypothetical protein